jgi:hypothetical protein
MRRAEPDPDLAALPDEVRAAAHVFGNGEVAWPNDVAATAIDALAANGMLILGLDARTLYPDGGVRETAVSAWEAEAGESPEAAVERARREALDALAVAQAEGTHVLVTWTMLSSRWLKTPVTCSAVRHGRSPCVNVRASPPCSQR